MNIHEIQIRGFGVWQDLELKPIPPGLTVVHGPNEAGKTTLMQFVRSVLYGYGESRRTQYLPARYGGVGGGRLRLGSGQGLFDVERLAVDSDDASVQRRGELTVTSPEGAKAGNHLLPALLGEMDEATYESVYAIGIRELQELGSLDDSEAAQLLYHLSTGLGNVSLVEVMRELREGREALYSNVEGSSRIPDLISERDRLRSEIDSLASERSRYGELSAEREALRERIDEIDARVVEVERKARLVELATTLREPWGERRRLRSALAEMDGLREVGAETLAEFESVVVSLRADRDEVERMLGRRKAIVEEARALPIQKVMYRHALRIEALAEQRPWIGELVRQIESLDAELLEIRTQIGDERARRTPAADGGRERHAEMDRKLPIVTRQTIGTLRPIVHQIRQCKVRRAESRTAYESAKANLASVEQRITSILGEESIADLDQRMSNVGDRVSQWRNRMQIDEKITRLERQQRELKEKSRDLLERQMIPTPWFVGTGVVAVIGGMLFGVGLLFPASFVGKLGLATVAVGAAAAVVIWCLRYAMEQSAEEQLEVCDRQMKVVKRQLRATKEERDRTDAELPKGGGPIASRLRSAESEMSALEELVPLDEERQAAISTFAAAREQVSIHRGEYRAACGRWRENLRRVGLPERWTPRRVRDLARQHDRQSEIARRLEYRQRELEERRKSLELIAERIDALANELNLSTAGVPLVERLDALEAALHTHQKLVGHRRELKREMRGLRKAYEEHRTSLRRWERKREKMLREAAVESEAELRDLVAQCVRRAELRRELATVETSIRTALGTQFEESTLAEALNDAEAETLESRWEELTARLEALESQRSAAYEQRGAIGEQLKAMSEDRSMQRRQLELGIVEQKLTDAVRKWQTLAVVELLLESIRREYEEHRQPETLREASRYLDRLTQGRYGRIWTGMAEESLFVDDDTGRTIAVEHLSRGTREQVFLALRLSLVRLFARRGARLPVVLDDVLVNFDADRTRAAAELLAEFASDDQQVLVFTCHPHIVETFVGSGATILELPHHNGRAAHAPAVAAPEPAMADPMPVIVEVNTEPEAEAEESSPSVFGEDLVDVNEFFDVAHEEDTEGVEFAIECPVEEVEIVDALEYEPVWAREDPGVSSEAWFDPDFEGNGDLGRDVYRVAKAEYRQQRLIPQIDLQAEDFAGEFQERRFEEREPRHDADAA